MLQPRSREERRKIAREYLRVARRFLDEGKNEIREGLDSANRERVREGAEKVFHALAEACAARVYDYGLPVPERHDETRAGLSAAKEYRLRDLYGEAFGSLHAKAYYQGWFEPDDLHRSIRSIENAIGRIGRGLEAP